MTYVPIVNAHQKGSLPLAMAVILSYCTTVRGGSAPLLLAVALLLAERDGRVGGGPAAAVELISAFAVPGANAHCKVLRFAGEVPLLSRACWDLAQFLLVLLVGVKSVAPRPV